MLSGDHVQLLHLDASGWRNVLDFYDAVLAALKSPAWHGRSPDALVDSMVWGGINDLQPPYRIVVDGLVDLSLREHVQLCADVIAASRFEYAMVNDQAVEVSLELTPL